MKCILIAAILVTGIQLHAETKIVKFIDANGKEPQMQTYDQNCQLVDCSNETIIPQNNIQLATGDHLVIQTPKTYGFYSYLNTYHYMINNGTIADLTELKALKNTDNYSQDNLFTDLHFDAVAPSTDSFDLRFTSNAYCPFIETPSSLLGHVTITVTE